MLSVLKRNQMFDLNFNLYKIRKSCNEKKGKLDSEYLVRNIDIV